MSYDLHLFRCAKGADPEASARASYESGSEDVNPGPGDPRHEEHKKQISDALMKVNAALQPFVFDHSEIAQLEQIAVDEARRRWRHIELNGPEDGNGIQINLHDETASLTVPYWHRHESARTVWDEIWRYLRILERDGGFRTYDPQLDRVLDLDADVIPVREMYAQGVTFTDSVAGERNVSPRKPWWKFW
jgi:hypothetical protein